MNISRKWLSDYVALNCDNDTLRHKLTMSGLEVEKLEVIGGVPAGVVTGKILERKPHPDSDHMSVCKVSIGTEELQIVCGAPNCDAGNIVPVATIGTVFTSEEGDFKIKKSKLRGVESFGMLCSATEIGVGDDDSGLLILPEDTVLGIPVSTLYPGQTAMELEVTPNRPDWLSLWGIARDVSCLLDVEPVFPTITVPECNEKAPNLVTVEASDLCSRYIGRIIKGVKVGPSPDWLVERLESVGLRSINNVVDVTNFVMMELGQPLHAFDLDKLEEKRVVVRRAKEGETIVTLDGSKLELNSNHLVIADAVKPMALAGVMGGEFSGVTEETCDVLLESAFFQSSNIRSTSRKLGISTDSSYRFERNVDWDMTSVASDRAVQLILEVAGGTLASEKVDVNTGRPAEAVIACKFERIRSLIGSSVTNDEMVSIFKKLQLKVSDVTETSCVVTVPLFRLDLTREADLAEEVARIDGLDKIPEIPVMGKVCHSIAEDAYLAVQTLRDKVVNLGFYECVHYSIISEADALTDGRFEANDLIKLDNPLSPDNSVMRPSLFGVMLGSIGRNIAKGNKTMALFELGKVFCATESKFPEERFELMMVLTGMAHSERYSDEARIEYDFFDLKGAVEALFESCNIKGVRLSRLENDKRYMPGRALEIRFGNQLAGSFGQLSTAYTKNWRTNCGVYACQLDFTALVTAMSRARKSYSALPQFPSTERDVAFTCPVDMENAQILDFIGRCKLTDLESARLFDIFTDEALEASGRKSMAYKLVFRNKEKTLTDTAVNAAVEKLRNKLATVSGIELR